MADNEHGSVFDMSDASSGLDLMLSEHGDAEVQVLTGEEALSVIGEQERAEIDMMITTAKRYPRSISRFVTQSRTLACATPQIAAGCSYALPRKDKGKMKTIIGPSVRLAEIVAPSWGNCRYGARITDIGERFVSVQGFFYDLQNNVGVAVDVRRRITDSHGNRYSDDMIQTTCQAAVSIAIRNAIFRGIPGGFVEAIRIEAQDIALGRKEGLDQQTKKAFKFFKDEHGIETKAVLRTLGISAMKDVTWGHMSRLMGFRTSIQTGESTADQIFSESHGTTAEGPPEPGRQTRRGKSPQKPAEESKEPEPGEETAAPPGGKGIDSDGGGGQESEEDDLGGI